MFVAKPTWGKNRWKFSINGNTMKWNLEMKMFWSETSTSTRFNRCLIRCFISRCLHFCACCISNCSKLRFQSSSQPFKWIQIYFKMFFWSNLNLSTFKPITYRSLRLWEIVKKCVTRVSISVLFPESRFEHKSGLSLLDWGFH